MGDRKPYLIVTLVQSIYTGMFLLSKAAFNGGMNNFIFVFYRQAAATLFLAPIAIFFERINAPPLSLGTFCKIFLHSLFGITLSMDIYGIALIYTSASLAAATTNCLPVITFFLAVLFRMEVVKFRTWPGIAKLVGIVTCMAGVATLAFYQGAHVKPFCLHHLTGHHSSQEVQHHAPSSNSWIKGCFLMLTSNSLWGIWLVFQAQVLKCYPSKLLLTTIQCFLSTIQSFVIAIAMERDPHKWRPGWDIGLLAISYCGIVVTGVTLYLQSWVIEKKGPVFLAMSTPLNLIFTLLCSTVLLCETITLGSFLGGIILVAGLYSVLWGKGKEKFNDTNIVPPVNQELSELKQVEAIANKV